MDEAYLLHCESEHAARTASSSAKRACKSFEAGPSVGDAPAQLELDSGASCPGRHLKRKALLSMISKWTAGGVPMNLFCGGLDPQHAIDSLRS